MRALSLLAIVVAAACAHARPPSRPTSVTSGAMKPPCTRTVGPADATALKSIVHELPAGAVLCLQPGTYEANLRIERSLTLRGLGPGVIVDGTHRSPTVEVVRDDVDLLLEGLTLARGAGGALGRGGNLHVHQAHAVTARDVVFEAGRSDANGGGGVLVREGTVRLEGCRFEGNRGRRAHALLIDGPATVLVRACLIVAEDAEAAALRVVGPAELQLERSTVIAAGVAVQVDGRGVDAPTVTIVDCVLGATPLVVDAPGPTPTVRVRDSALAQPLPAVTETAGNLVGPLELDEHHRPRPGSIAAGRGAGL